jgi:hypothetical protein
MKFQFSSILFLVVVAVFSNSRTLAAPTAKSHLAKHQPSTSTKDPIIMYRAYFSVYIFIREVYLIDLMFMSRSMKSDISVTAAGAAGGTIAPATELPSAVKLLIGVGGIYAAFLYYGTLQEDVFHFAAASTSQTCVIYPFKIC